MSSVTEQTAQKLPVSQIDHEQIHKHLDAVVRDSVEATLNALLDADADELCGAKRYERSAGRLDTRAGHYTRKLHTKAGEVELKMPKLRNLPFETAIIERYRRRETTSVEEALVEMYLAGVSTRRVEDITEALWGTRVSSSTVSELNKKIYGQIEQWRNRPIEGQHPYVFWDGIWLKRCWPITATGDDAFTVGTVGHAGNPLHVTREGVEFLALIGVPYLQRLVCATGNDAIAVRTVRNAVHTRPLPCEGVDLPSCPGVPHLQRAVKAAGDDPFTIGV
jgi:hypothetical protein